jgi:hypothetical protein
MAAKDSANLLGPWLGWSVAFALGVGASMLVDTYRAKNSPTGTSVTSATHWSLVRRYLDQLKEEIASPDAHPGPWEPPYALEPSLTALAAHHELDEVDLIFPNVPYRDDGVMKFVMKSLPCDDDVIYWTGNSTYAGFSPTGAPPLHLRI